MAQNDRLVAALSDLGFSVYEARAYVGLLQAHGQTAYGVSKITGVPQPKIYEALRKLVTRGAAAVVGANPTQFAAVPPEAVLGQLRADFSTRIDLAEDEAARALAGEGHPTTWPEVMTGLRGRTAVVERAHAMLGEAREKVYLSGWGSELQDLAAAIDAAEERGVFVIVLAFGRDPVRVRNGQVFRHSTTSKAVYPSHQTRHLAMVCDGRDSLWAVSLDNSAWSALSSQDGLLIGLVRGFIRHDIYVQKTHEQFGPEMEAVFGPGLELLADASSDHVLQTRAPAALTESPPQRSVG